MEQEKVSVKMNFCYNPIMAHHVHLSWEGVVLPGQKAEEVWEATIQRIEEFYKTNFGEDGSKAIPLKGVTEDKPIDPLDSFVQAITTCTTMKSLESFRKLIERENKPELYEAYNQTKKRLENE